ncbi:resistin-like beta isoform X2 [Acomys russatus]|uniref:resistin-like beta isoform X2 n=1 Tax=Acomys russatus TaxID=60746 RepID=UPI0021E31698|nr:resistin-like beta isoform X2 [Acomys russatus]
MKSTMCFLLISIFLLQLMIPVNTQHSLDTLVNEMIKENMSSTETKKLSCTSVKSEGRLATCPAGMAVTGCACGYGCGSWDIRNGNTCHCQCSVMDWTTARCCRMA